MKKQFKARFLCAILSAAMLFGMMPERALAWRSEGDEGSRQIANLKQTGVYFDAYENGYAHFWQHSELKVSNGIGADPPGDSLAITSLAHTSFEGAKDTKTSAYYYYDYKDWIRDLEIGEDHDTFSTKVTINGSKKINDGGIMVIGCHAFDGYENLEKLTWHVYAYDQYVGDGVKGSLVSYIGDYAFANCKNLKEIYLLGTAPNDYKIQANDEWTKMAADNAFQGVEATVFVYPNSGIYTNSSVVQNYGGNLTWAYLYDRTNLAKGTGNIKAYLTFDGKMVISGTGDMKDLSSQDSFWEGKSSLIKEVVVEPGITGIGDYAFAFCSNLEKITLPDSVTRIGEGAFEHCNNLTSIQLSSNLKSIGKEAFVSCEKLSDVKFPSKLESIGDDAFYDCVSLTEAILPEGLKTIGDYAFCLCVKMENMTIPSTVTKLGLYSLAAGAPSVTITLKCENPTLGGCLFSSNSGTHYNVTYPRNGIWTESTRVNACAKTTNVSWQLGPESGSCGTNLTWSYENHTLTINGTGKMTNYSASNSAPWKNFGDDLRYVIISEGVESIGDYAFYNNDPWKATIAASVKTIGKLAFANSSSLNPITFLGKPTTIAEDAFKSVSAYAYYNTEDGWTATSRQSYGGDLTWEAIGGRCGENLFWSYEVVDGLNVLNITGSGAMYDYIGNANTVVGPNPFGCGYDVINFPEGITHIGAGAFRYNDIKTLTLPSTVTSIGEEAFRYCTDLQKVTIPDSVYQIGSYAFADCTSLEEFVFPEKAYALDYGILKNCSSLKSVKLPSKATEIPSHLLNGCSKLTSVEIPAGVTSIGQYAFYNCSGLNSLTIPEGVKKIELKAFMGCTGITSLNIPSGVTKIATSVFANMTKLATINLPGGVTVIDKNAFDGCSALTRVSYGGSEEMWDEIDINATGNDVLRQASCVIEYHGGSWGSEITWGFDEATGTLTIRGTGNISNGSNVPWSTYKRGVTKVVVEKGITGIGSGNFINMFALTEVSLPEGLITIGTGAFQNDNKLTNINIPSTVSSIGSKAFYGCALETVTIPDRVTSISESTFYNCANLKTITIPRTVTSIGNNNFDLSTSLKDVYYTGSKTEWDSVSIDATNNLRSRIEEGAVTLHCTGILNGTCGANLTWTVLEDRDMDGDGLNDRVLLISGTGAMYDYSSYGPWGEWCDGIINYVYIEEGVTSIGEEAFRGNRLKSVALPASLKRIEEKAFYSCTVKEVTYAGTSSQYNEINICTGNEALAKSNLITNWSNELDTCLITFNTNGHGTKVTSQQVKMGGTAEEPKAPTDPKYELDGWYLDKACTEKYDFSSVLTKDLTLYAGWSSAINITGPAAVTVDAGKTAYFEVEAVSGEGLELTYQWKKSTDGGKIWLNSSSNGAKTSSLSMVAKESFNGYLFRCDVTDANGKTRSSEVVKLTVKSVTKITLQPKNVTASVGANAVFTVDFNGANATYQWKKSTNGGASWSNCGSTGNKTKKLTVENVKAGYNGYLFCCIVTDEKGNTYESNVAKLTVNTVATAPVITTQPANKSVAAGTTATFKVAADGDGMTYQWMKSTDGGKTWSNSGSNGATTNTLTMTAKISFNGYLFKCVVTDKNGKSVESNAAKLTVTSATTTLAITSQPTSVTAVTGTNAVFSVKADGEGLTYQWMLSKDNGATWANSGSTGAKTATLTMAARMAYNGYQVKCVVTDKNGKSVTSKAATLTVVDNSSLAIESQPSSVSVVTMTDAVFSVKARGEGLTYQWQKSTDGTTWVNSGSAGAKTDTLTISARVSMNGMKLRCVVTDKNGKSVTSNVVTLTVTSK